MNFSDHHLCQAKYHLQQSANANWSHLLREKDYELWTRRVLESQASRAALEILADASEIRPVRRDATWLPNLGYTPCDIEQQLVDEQL